MDKITTNICFRSHYMVVVKPVIPEWPAVAAISCNVGGGGEEMQRRGEDAPSVWHWYYIFG